MYDAMRYDEIGVQMRDNKQIAKPKSNTTERESRLLRRNRPQIKKTKIARFLWNVNRAR